jgi:crotonobetainyl-CoA:carnitine CoA-transferase CaiB-like acyl-CoA transferase
VLDDRPQEGEKMTVDEEGSSSGGGVHRTGPLVGLRVLELATILMGPYAGQLFGALGAEVIKVGDARDDSPLMVGDGSSAQLAGAALNLHANKRSIALDLKSDSGRAALIQVMRRCDVFITNLRPQSLQRLRLTYDDLAPDNPRLVYCQAGGFRSDSEDGGRPMFDDIAQALSGLASLSAEMGLEMRFMPTVIGDKICGMTMVNSVLAALVYRGNTGVGQRIEVPMVETLLAFNLVEHLADATVPGGRPGYSRVLASHRGPHRTRDGWIALLPYTDRHWESLYRAIGCEDKLEQPWHRDALVRLLEAERVYEELAQVVALRTTSEWLELCEGLDIPASRVPTLEQIVSDETWHRGVLVDAEHPVVGPYRAIRQAPVFSASQPSDHLPAPLVGQDGREILSEAGYGDAEIDALAESGALRVTPPS